MKTLALLTALLATSCASMVNGELQHGDRWRRAVLESIATLGRACGATPIAEGVETAADLETLLDVGIDTVQGSLYARSMPPEELAYSLLFSGEARYTTQTS